MCSADRIGRDITERECAEAALRDAKEFSENLIRTANVMILGLDTEGNVNLLNDAGEEITGYSFTELKGKSWSILVPKDRFPEVWAEFDSLVGGTAGKTFENPILTKSGEERYIAWRNSIVKVNGKVVATISFGNDITERKAAEEALRRQEENYRRFVAQSSEGIFREEMDAPVSIDLPEDELVQHILFDSYMAECNDALARMYGFTSGEQLIGKRLSEMLEMDDPRNIELTREYIRSGFKVEERESHEVDIKGNRKVFRNSMIGIVENRRLVRTWGIQRDVTEQVKAAEGQKKAEQLLVKSEERFRVALKDSPITVFNQDRDLRYTWIYNPQDWQHEAIGKTDAEILGSKQSASLEELKRRVLKTGVALRQEMTIPNGDRTYAFDVSLEPLFDPEGNVIGITGASVDIAQLREMTDRLQDARDKLAQEKSYLESEIQAELGFEEIIGQSPALLDVLKDVRVVAPTESTVLLLGETGTGKELVARSLHSLSSRRNQTFIKLNCAAVPVGLLESELFGHEKGAFTGAVSQKIGRIELADKGTLLLDEIGELPLVLQPKLLRVLQDREFERLGGVRTFRVDVRIISSTNRDLHQDVGDKKFREDLFYRLNVFPIELPALRRRRTDIPILVHHFVRKHSARMGKHIDTIPIETMKVLQNWNWPGNIRELENMIERMVILSKTHVLADPPIELDAPQEVGEDNLTEMEREHIVRVLRETNGVLSGVDGAASRLGIKRTTLQSMLKRFGIELENYRSESGSCGLS
jgi:PAS domain S-box-containing protein